MQKSGWGWCRIPSYPKKTRLLRVQKDLDWKLLSSFVNFGILKSMISHPKRRPIEKMIKLKTWSRCKSSLECVWVYPKGVPVNWGNDLFIKFLGIPKIGVMFCSWVVGISQTNPHKQKIFKFVSLDAFDWSDTPAKYVMMSGIFSIFWPPCHRCVTTLLQPSYAGLLSRMD